MLYKPNFNLILALFLQGICGMKIFFIFSFFIIILFSEPNGSKKKLLELGLRFDTQYLIPD